MSPRLISLVSCLFRSKLLGGLRWNSSASCKCARFSAWRGAARFLQLLEAPPSRGSQFCSTYIPSSAHQLTAFLGMTCECGKGLCLFAQAISADVIADLTLAAR